MVGSSSHGWIWTDQAALGTGQGQITWALQHEGGGKGAEEEMVRELEE